MDYRIQNSNNPFFYYLTNKVQKVYNISFPTGNITSFSTLTSEYTYSKTYFKPLIYILTLN